MLRTLAAPAVATLLLLSAGPARSATPAPDPWKEIETLLSETKVAEAAEVAARVREAAQKAGDEAEWMRGLIQEAQLGMVLSGAEESYGVLRGAEWPRDPIDRAILHLYTAELLRAYNQQFSWRINQRERIEKPEEETGVLDLERATRGEIQAALLAEAAEAWKVREQLSAVPLERVHRYLIPNEYPEEVRGTLRDAVSYLIANVLSDSAFWSVEEAQDLPRADLPGLIAGTVEAALDAAAVHPLARMAAVLGDLEAWHASRGERAAALEVRRERLRLLWAHFDDPVDRELLRGDLEEQLAAFRDISWWAMGRSTLGDFVRDQGDLVRARELLREAYAAYPESIGGTHSLRRAEEIEAPAFQLSGMAGDGLGRRSIRVWHKNVSRLRFRAYAVDLKARSAISPWSMFPAPREIPASTPPVAEWETELPPTPDFEAHHTYVTPPIERPGAYLVVATPLPEPKGPKEKERQAAVMGIVLGDLVLSSQTGSNESTITALSGATGEPVSGVDLRVSSEHRGRDGKIPQTSLVTGAEGRVQIPHAPYESTVVLASKGEEIAYVRTGYAYDNPLPEMGTMVFTDRAIYRPQQTVFWKILVFRRQAEGEPVIARGQEVEIKLIDPNGQAVAARGFTTNEFGTAAGSFSIPVGRPLGGWRLESSAGGAAYLQVEEYKRPTFEVTLDDPADAVRLDRPATFSGKARYYFGLPVSDGSVRWRVVREPVWNLRWWGWNPPSHGEWVVATGTAALDDAGVFRLTFLPVGDESVDPEGATWRFRIEAEVTDAGGETRQAERALRLGQAAVEAQISLEEQRNFLLAQTPATVVVRRTSLEGLPRPGEGSWTLVAVRQPERALLPADQPLPPQDGYRTPGDGLRPREEPGDEPAVVLASWEDGEQIASGTVRHKEDGRAEIVLPALATGVYRLRYETVDEFGTRVETQRELIVAARQTKLVLPLALAAELSQVRVGGTIRLLAHSGLPDQPLFLEIYQGGRLRERRMLRSGRQPSLIEIPVGAKDRGGLAFKLFGVRDHQRLHATAKVFVPWDRELSIELATFRDRIRPGARETWTVTVRTPKEGDAEAAAAEVLALMYDRSLDLFSQHSLPDPLTLFPNRTDLWEDTWSLGVAPVTARPALWDGSLPVLRGDRLRLPVGGGYHPWIALLTTPATPEEEQRLAKLNLGFARGGVASRMAPMAVATEARVESLEISDMAATSPPPPPPPPPPPAPQAAANVATAELRRDFRETALWEPRLLTGPDGSAKIEFTVPDSVTSWNFWVQALTRDLRAGSLTRQVESVKELMVRPYLPRFLREGDRADLKVAVDNASEAPMSGEVELDVIDPETEESLLGAFGLTRESARLPFKAAAGRGTTVTFPLTAPRRVGPVAFRVTAVAPGARDGELRPLPVLPARMHLAQSRSVALREKGRREMTFPDLARDDDPTRIDEQLVVTVDGQLFYGLLAALPYLVDYPYECTEQTMNRFVSTGILTSLFDRHPGVARMAEELAKRETPLETWDSTDPNRKMALEETPWLVESQGLRKGEKNPSIRVLDPRVANAERASALAKLAKAQLENGAFPWWAGGPESPYMTVYLLYGFAKAREFGVEVPEHMVQRGWSYLGEWLRTERKDEFKQCGCWPLVTFLNYAASASPAEWTKAALTDEDRRQMLAISWEHRFQMTPYLKSLLSLTLHRMGRKEDGRNLLTGLLSSAKTTPDEGTFWTQGEHGWVWYEDSIETHAFVLRAVQDLLPEDPRRHGLVQWLFLQKQLNHWRSTRDTAEVIYAVSVYLEREKQLGVREEARVRIGARTQDFVFEPDRYTGKENRVIVPGEEVGPAEATVVVEKETPGFLFATSTWHFSTEKLPEQGDGQLFQVERSFFRRVKTEREVVLQPLENGEVLHPGDEVEVHLRIRSRAAAEYVHLRDPRPAGLEPDGARSGWRWGDGTFWYEETRDSGMNFFFESLPAGEYTLKHRVRANLAGTFRAGPATIQSMYAPEHTGYSAGREVRVE